MTGSNDKPILILGGTGKTGRRIAGQLAAMGMATRIGSRAAKMPFDWQDRQTWLPCLDGAAAAYISYHPDLAVPGAADTVGDFARLAVENGVKRLVLLSGRGEEEAQRTEELVKASGADWTILRCAWFAQNFSESMMLEPILAGEVALPVGDVREPFIDADDIAEAAVLALTKTGHAGQLYELTGPRLLSFADAIAEIAAASGRNIHFSRISQEAFDATLKEQQVPADYIWLLDELFVRVLDGRNAHLADGIQRILGRPPKDFSEYCRQTAATAIWDKVP